MKSIPARFVLEDSLNRVELRQLATERIDDAHALLVAGRWSGAYFLAGYAVECGLKACISRLTNQHDYPDKDIVLRSYTHKIETLVEVAGLKRQRDADAGVNPPLFINWNTAKRWDEQSRYKLWSEIQARKIVAAISEPNNGVLPWIAGHW